MMAMITFLLLLVALSKTACAAPAEDEVASLPGWPDLLSRQWSGFLTVNVSSKRRLHYWAVESEGDPVGDPVVLWLNGGPGCSSLDGLLYEHGPLLLDEHANLVRNNWTWAKTATLLYLESPAGVGFSNSQDPADYTTDDFKTTADTLRALEVWREMFPEFATQDFYVAGESYGGVYVPMLADAIDKAGTIPSFSGFLVGNGGPSCGAGDRDASVEAAYGHNVISSELYARINAACNFSATARSESCKAALAEMEACSAGLNVYDDFRDCYHHENDPLATGEVPCIDTSQAGAFLNRPEVQAAIHVRPEDASTAGWWQMCNQRGGGKNDTLEYESNDVDIAALYPRLASEGYKINVYVGDLDGGAQRRAEWCLSSLFSVQEKWAPWTYEKVCPGGPDPGERYCQRGTQVGGFRVLYDADGTNEVLLTTVHGSGHMVPQWRPQAAFEMFSRFVR